jgi:hypothetical protein
MVKRERTGGSGATAPAELLPQTARLRAAPSEGRPRSQTGKQQLGMSSSFSIIVPDRSARCKFADLRPVTLGPAFISAPARSAGSFGKPVLSGWHIVDARWSLKSLMGQ